MFSKKDAVRKFLKLSTFITSGLLFLTAILNFNFTEPQSLVLSIYISIFGVLLLLCEFGKCIKYFGFLHNYFGRGFFILFIGFTLTIFIWDNMSGKISGIICIILGLLQLFGYLIFRNKDDNTEVNQDNVNQDNISQNNNMRYTEEA